MKANIVSSTKTKDSSAIFFISEDLKFQCSHYKYDYAQDVKKALKAMPSFKGKKGQIMSFMPSGKAEFDHVILVGLGDKDALTTEALMSLGGKIASNLNTAELTSATVCVNFKHKKFSEAEIANNVYCGCALKNYKFTEYFVAKKDDHKTSLKSLNFCLDNEKDAQKLFDETEMLVSSVNFTRNIVSEPGNVIYPETFMQECKKLSKLGLKITVLDQKQMKKMGMNALLGVAQGSEKEPYLVVMEWNGAKSSKDKPIAFVGKGVTFDSGGISIKPATNMGDMKYDMAGAGAVTGTMRLLAQRKAKVHAIGVVALVENMPSGTAQRPGDVVKSYSGQTIEIDNTDAEGRLILCDALWYTQKTYKPKCIIDLATLTGAIVIALGENYCAGLFSNDDKLSDELTAAGKKNGEKLWRMPLDEFYDKQVNSEIADVRNTGTGRGAGSTTAAQFLYRFIDNTPWAHLDIAGMAWDKSGSDIQSKGATGFGVRLLNGLVKEFYEQK